MDESAPALESPLTPEPPRAVVTAVSFTGQGREYFRIWIVNLALTIVTLGAYSAWAKVRRLQYFYRNTHVAGAAFDYHGDPIAIFKGRIIAAILFGAYTFSGLVGPVATLATIVGIGAILPWLLSRSLRFRLHNTSYRGLRFRFTGSTRSAYWVFLALPVLTLLSLFLLGPMWHQRLKRYQFGNASYGHTPFAMSAPTSDFYVLHIFAAFLGFVVVIALGSVVGVMAAAGWIGPEVSDEEAVAAASEAGAVVSVVLLAAVYVVGILAVQAFLGARIRNLVWNFTKTGEHRFISNTRTRRLLWIQLSNFLATICTLGFFWPVGQIRLSRYLAETLSVEGPPSFDHFCSADSPEEEATGDEVAGIFDFDIAF